MSRDRAGGGSRSREEAASHPGPPKPRTWRPVVPAGKWGSSPGSRCPAPVRAGEGRGQKGARGLQGPGLGDTRHSPADTETWMPRTAQHDHPPARPPTPALPGAWVNDEGPAAITRRLRRHAGSKDRDGGKRSPWRPLRQLSETLTGTPESRENSEAVSKEAPDTTEVTRRSSREQTHKKSKTPVARGRPTAW